MRIFIIAGEASGDLHGSNLVKALRQQSPKFLEFWGVGGDHLQQAGMHLLEHVKNIQVVGFTEVLKKLWKIRSLFTKVKSAIKKYKPHAIILIDYPGFNLRIAPYAKANGVKVFYYIAPQLWAWKSGRVKIIKRYVDKLFVILPFEKDFYARYGVEAHYVGHPLMDIITPPKRPPSLHAPDLGKKQWKQLLLLPGSRKEEVKRMLPIMLKVAERFSSEFKVSISVADTLSERFFYQFNGIEKFPLVKAPAHELLRVADFALTTSGTVTLETALLRVPQIIGYKGNPLSYWIAKRLVKVQHIGLPNLIVGRTIVPELIQNQYTVEKVSKQLYAILEDWQRQQQIQKGYEELQQRLGGPGASQKTAKGILEALL